MQIIEAQICALAIRPATRAPLEECQALQIDATDGVCSDHGNSARRHITLFSEEQWRAACDQIGVDLPWTTRRANVLLRGLEFGPSHARARITIGDVSLQVHGELTPCFRMEEQATGLHDALVPEWRGGVHAEVISGGQIGIGDTVRLEFDDR